MARGDKLGAGLSLVACIPFAGPLAKGAKMAKAIGKAVPGLAKGAGKVMNTAQKARNIAQTAFQEVLSVVKPLKGKMTTGSKMVQNKVVKDLVEVKTAMKVALDKVQSNLGGKMATEFAFDAGFSIGFEYMAEKTGVDLSLFSLLGTTTTSKRKLGATNGRGSSNKNRNTKSNGNGKGKNPNRKEPSEKKRETARTDKDKGYMKIDRFREKAGLQPYSANSGDTVARIEINGRGFFGVNSSITEKSKQATKELRKKWLKEIEWVPPKKKVPAHLGHAQSLTHAESFALIRAYERLNELPKKVTMYVDRKTCNICRGEMPALLKRLGIDELEIFSGGSTTPIILKATK